MLKSAEKKFRDESVKKAIELLSSECYGAMQMCNALGGVLTEEWEILHNNSWADIVKEGQDRGLDFSTMKCAVTETPLEWSASYQYAIGNIDNDERRKRFWKEVKIDGVWRQPVVAGVGFEPTIGGV